MVKLSDFPPPCAAPEVAKPEWECAPCGVTRDSDALTRANFDALCDRLDNVDPNGDDWEILWFNHFACGWVEQMFVRPGTRLAEICAETRASLAQYPCLNEDLWLQYENEEKAPTE